MEELGDLLERIDTLIKTDERLTVKALGILLLGKAFDVSGGDEEPKDPTELILKGRGPRAPRL